MHRSLLQAENSVRCAQSIMRFVVGQSWDQSAEKIVFLSTKNIQSLNLLNSPLRRTLKWTARKSSMMQVFRGISGRLITFYLHWHYSHVLCIPSWWPSCNKNQVMKMVPFLLKAAHQTEPSSRIIAGDVGMRAIMAELVFQWWLLWKSWWSSGGRKGQGEEVLWCDLFLAIVHCVTYYS